MKSVFVLATLCVCAVASATPKDDQGMLLPAAILISIKNVCARTDPSHAERYSNEVFEKFLNEKLDAGEIESIHNAMKLPQFAPMVKEIESMVEESGRTEIEKNCASFPNL